MSINPYMLLEQHGDGLFYGRSRRSAYESAQSLYNLTGEDMLKALATNGTIGDDMSPLIGESLDPVVQSITLNEKNFTPKMRRWRTFKANAIDEEFNLLTSLGTLDGSWTQEGDIGRTDASTWSREHAYIRNMSQVGAVTRTAARASRAKFGDLKKREAYLRLRSLLLHGERDFWWGNTGYNSLAAQGLFQSLLTDTEHLIDKVSTGTAGARTTYTGGGTLQLSDVRNQNDTALEYDGLHSALYCSPQEKISLGTQQDSNVRYTVQSAPSRVEGGIVMDRIISDFGQSMDIVWDIFLRHERGMIRDKPKDPAVSTNFHPQSPAILAAAPTATASAPATTTPTGGHLPAAITFYYGVQPVNESGPGPILIETTGALTDNTNGGVDVTWTHPAHVADIRSYRIWRSTQLPSSSADYSHFRFVGEVAKDTTLATQTWTDTGEFIPGSRRAVLMDESAVAVPELLPPSMRDLADIDNSHRFVIDWEWAIQIYDQALRQIHWKNIGGSVSNPS